MRTTRNIAAATIAALALGAGVVASPPSASAQGTVEREPASDRPDRLAPGQRNVIRTATERFRDVDAATAAGYLPTEECAAVPGLGGMGYHFVNPGLMDDRIDPRAPEILLYADGPDGLELVGVEYFRADADQDPTTDDDRPKLLGRPFDDPMAGHGPGMPVHYDLHAWVFAENPSGELAAWNPDVTCPNP